MTNVNNEEIKPDANKKDQQAGAEKSKSATVPSNSVKEEGSKDDSSKIEASSKSNSCH